MRRTAGARARLGLALVAVAGVGGCARFEAPPVDLSFRDSLVGAGKIVRISNTSNRPLTGVEITISAPSGESRTFLQDELGGFETLEIGWKKLGGWQVPADAEVAIRTEGYWRAFRGRLAGPETDG